METRILLILLVFLTIFDSEAQKLRAEFAMARFDSPSDGPYLETYLKLRGNSLGLIETKDGKRSEVVLTYKVQKGNKVVFKDAFKMDGPIVGSDSLRQDFIDVQRIPLKKGKYDLTITLSDASAPELTQVELNQQIEMRKKVDFRATLEYRNRPSTDSFLSSQVGGSTSEQTKSGGFAEAIHYYISDLQLVDSYKETTKTNVLSKNGFELIPYTSNYYPEPTTTLTFYTEIYNTEIKAFNNKGRILNLVKNKEEKLLLHKFLIRLFVESADDGRIVENLHTYFKHDSARVIPILHSFNLESLPSGNYNLVLELRNSENELHERKAMFFQRENASVSDYVRTDEASETAELDITFVGKYNRAEDLKEYLRCLHPISTQEEIHQVNRKINFNDVEMMKKFMYNFWKQRDPDNPEQAWLKYWKQVEKVNANYSNNLRKGYDTDRGRVYLQYGAPNTISPNLFEPNTYPYEIWHYYVLKDHLHADQSNSKFIFANTEQGDKEYKLIHSDARNEITNVRWNYDLHKRSNATIDIDQEDAGSHYGGRSKEFFDNPY